MGWVEVIRFVFLYFWVFWFFVWVGKEGVVVFFRWGLCLLFVIIGFLIGDGYGVGGGI